MGTLSEDTAVFGTQQEEVALAKTSHHMEIDSASRDQCLASVSPKY